MVTTASSPLMSPIHDRMPAVLRTEEVQGFLDPEIRWNFQPFTGLLLVTPCASPMVKPRDKGLQQELF